MDAAALELLNRLANDPTILPAIAPGHDSVDLAEFFVRPHNLMVGDEHGAVCFIHMGEGFFAAHFLFPRGHRGKAALAAIHGAFSALFTYRDAVAITGLIPRENRASCVMARALGCRRIGVSKDTAGRSCISYLMERSQWVNLSVGLLAVSGRC